MLTRLLGDADTAVACSAALALGRIRTAEASKHCRGRPSNEQVKQAVTDSSLACAEGLLAADKPAEAQAIYEAYTGADQPKHVRLAATRGMLACAGKKQ